MSYDRNKQEWFDKERRHKLALAIIDKMEKTDKEDFNLIPALNRYIETGDESIFEDYIRYRETTTVEERIKNAKEAADEVEERAKAAADYAEQQVEWCKAREQRARERLRKIEDNISDIYNIIKEKEKAYNEKMQAYRERMEVIRNTETSDIVCTGEMTMKNLQDFCSEFMAEGGYSKKFRKLWATKDGRLYYVKGFAVVSGKAVFSIDDNSVIPPKP